MTTNPATHQVVDNFKAFRQGESEFYDLYRRVLDRPLTFGEGEEQQIAKYFADAEIIRKAVRNAETENLPTLENPRTRI